MILACPLCTSEQTQHFFEDKNRTYQQCSECELVFVPSNYHLSQKDEKQVYDFHENSPEDQGYRQFLNKLLSPLSKKLPPQAQGLDFGCGPGPTIKPMLEAVGFSVKNYDFYYYNKPEALQEKYDFITCTEAIEHFSHPRKELQLIDQALKTGGYLGLMTKRATNLEDFKTWHYKNDPTHISFFSEASFQWIAQWLGYTVEFPGDDTVIMKKDF